MSQRVNPYLKQDLLEFGVKDWNECFHCGNCTATCPLTEDGSLFPRKAIRQAQMGLKLSLEANVDPWLCYYCGDCSETCPRDANPGELMMSLRRYLTSVYDWTGLSKLFYTKKSWELIFIFIFGFAVILLFLLFPQHDTLVGLVNQQGGVKINTFAPIKIIEFGDWTMAAIVGGLLISNILRMWYKTILKPRVSVPFLMYFVTSWNLIFQFGTQAKFSKCDKKSRVYWLSHWLLMSGYVIMFAVVVVFLPQFQTEEIHEWYHWQRLLGYYATFGLLVGLTVMLVGRIKKSGMKFMFSHASDWLFIIMLLLTTITGILVHFFRIYGLVEATYYTYILHLAVLTPMIFVEVPFSKWSHLAYRPFAIYFDNLKKAAIAKQYKSKLATAA